MRRYIRPAIAVSCWLALIAIGWSTGFFWWAIGIGLVVDISIALYINRQSSDEAVKNANETIVVDGHTIEYSLRGDGEPSFVCLSGDGMPLESWHKVCGRIESLGTIFRYNRLGIGHSSKPAEAQSGEVVVSTLRRVLTELGLEPPYVLLGHSSGGLFANLFARRYPGEVAGIVLIDSSHPDQEERFRPHASLVQRCLLRLAKRNLNSELAAFGGTAREIQQAGAFPQIPLVVVTGTKNKGLLHNKSMFAAHQANQTELVSLSRFGKHVMAEQSGHFPQLTEPELVANAVRSLLGRSQSRFRTTTDGVGLR